MKRCNGCARLAIVLASLGAAAPVGTAHALTNDHAVGTTVTFRNDDDMIHSIVATDGSFRSKALDTGDEFSFTFSRPGEFAFVCGLHPFMHGKVTVTP